mmetsp:Transcript_19221/g.26603  ORF Transcript_19221/g.26603 Transcript_19221/m.26603 type:complete len:268 (+) Transcript_19221:95-898(+)|eukprot:CAMPEP_0196594386 /NCGR_PEP_ID=MMETSP1081-20130531/78246_1 /TAXON_ID=36882 /ORGANISM="Pyramimonas amylifera, Strain CCMP720" /LENGTH=267 /DNA_ID=CAMNT_0041918643 /DNA_START=94 /DNA_END=897 /DNA_ORIENTATION=-
MEEIDCQEEEESVSEEELVDEIERKPIKTGRGFWTRSAAILFFSLVIFQFPFFEQTDQGTKENPYTVRVSPIQVVVSQLMITNTIPEDYLRAVLFPGATARQVQKTFMCVAGLKTKGCRKKVRWVPAWKNLIKNNDPAKVDVMMSKEYKDRKVQLVAGSFFCLLGGVYVLFSNSRLPVFGVVLYFYPLLRKGLLPTHYLWMAGLCALVTIHIGDLGKTTPKAKPAPKPKSNSKTTSAEEAAVKLEYLKDLETKAKLEKAERMKSKDA